ncbi:MAG: sigma 54-interacting transcriptional regulator [Deltaproteobacteria bacterium]|nr:sigma 54-interacting transcriptional regulator [Deltaproteobacteria bacterium]
MMATKRQGNGASGPVRVHLVVSSPRSSRIYDLEEGQMLLVGRSSEIEVTVDDPMVSRIHTQVERLEKGVAVTDRGSSNGTWVNGKMIAETFVIGPGDEVKLGSTVLTIVEASALPMYRRSVMPHEELMVRFGYELERARLHGVPMGLIYMDPSVFVASEDRLVSTFMEVMGPGDMLGHAEENEFLVLLPEGSRQRTEGLVRQFLELVLDPTEARKGIGVAVFPDGGMDTASLLATARRTAARREWRRSIAPQPTPDDDARAITVVEGVSADADPEQSFIARDPAMRSLIKLAKKVAVADVPVLITGETGAGKEVLARYVHINSPRKKGPFVKVNCATLPPSVIESELFGHEKGGFTGADEKRIGFFESGNFGTVMLDEITELPLSIQAKLLRFLDDFTITRVGSSKEVLLDVRVLALTNRDVEEEVRTGRFRQDLYYRLSTFVLFVPPLRGRRADIPVLARYFTLRASRRSRRPVPVVTDAYLDRLASHTWPGNVRELRNVVENSLIRADEDELLPEHLPALRSARDAPPLPNGVAGGVSGTMRQRKEAAEAEEIRKALDSTGGNQTAAAKILGVSRRTLWTKIRQYGIEVKKGG